MGAEWKLRLQRTEKRRGAGCGLEEATAGEGTSGFGVGIAVVMSSSFGVLVSSEKPPGTFPFEPTKKAASPRGLDVSPEAAALRRPIVGPSRHRNEATRLAIPNSAFVPDRTREK